MLPATLSSAATPGPQYGSIGILCSWTSASLIFGGMTNGKVEGTCPLLNPKGKGASLCLIPAHLCGEQRRPWQREERPTVLGSGPLIAVEPRVTRDIEYEHGLSDLLKVNRGVHVRAVN